MDQDSLEEIGLSKNESKIYLFLSELGSSTIGEISSKTGIHRRNVYDSLEKLEDKGFIFFIIKDGKKYFDATGPERIIKVWEERKEKLKQAISGIIRRRRRHVSMQNVWVYTGIEGRKIIFEDKLKYKSEQLVLGAHQPSEKIIRYVEIYHKKRIDRKTPLRSLYPLSEIKAAKYFSKLKYIKVRILPKHFSFPIAINIYADKVAMFIGSDKHLPLTILIEDEELSNNFRNYFYMLWKIAKDLKDFSK